MDDDWGVPPFQKTSMAVATNQLLRFALEREKDGMPYMSIRWATDLGATDGTIRDEMVTQWVEMVEPRSHGQSEDDEKQKKNWNLRMWDTSLKLSEYRQPIGARCNQGWIFKLTLPRDPTKPPKRPHGWVHGW